MSCLCCGRFVTDWQPGDDLKQYYPARHSDYRDSVPLDMKTVYDIYKPYVKDGAWTFGLFEMWFPKAKAVKHSVHIPCWDSFRLNPCQWRGVCFGRTMLQCYWTGLKQMRWSRGVYGAALGREYIMPVHDISKHGKGFKSDIKALCLMYGAMGSVFGMGIGQIFTLCGNVAFNFAACYSCHSREKIRRKYNLPPTFGLPPGLDDCLVHFICAYCASHQEVRELAVRGVDGPGMHIMDVAPEAFSQAEGYEEALKARQEVVAAMVAHPPRLFKPRVKTPVEHGAASEAAMAAGAAKAGVGPEAGESAGDDAGNDVGDMESVSSMAFGWVRYSPPTVQMMGRGPPLASSKDVGNGGAKKLEKSWSVAY